MEKPALRVTAKKYSGESSIISMRIPKDMVKDFDEIAAKKRKSATTPCSWRW